MIDFFVPGVPVAKGSSRAFLNRKTGKPIIIQNNQERQKPWVSMIGVVAQGAMPGNFPLGPVSVGLEFKFPRPKSHFTKKGLRTTAPLLHCVKPDIDKLARAVLDALTGIIFRDDSQVCELISKKSYTDAVPGVRVRVMFVNE